MFIQADVVLETSADILAFPYGKLIHLLCCFYLNICPVLCWDSILQPTIRLWKKVMFKIDMFNFNVEGFLRESIHLLSVWLK